MSRIKDKYLMIASTQDELDTYADASGREGYRYKSTWARGVLRSRLTDLDMKIPKERKRKKPKKGIKHVTPQEEA